ncbi:hypothetical protein CPSG_02036 [Coccidioides posadasii str. Silveira]|uniref:Uncharacterized protein n=1 Tax=Coccidioides posadasii (strain RMSCC 757 / Silveira) TaxID=443226 RepID=E9CX53_COCPS|nr:hypothetical protein CPSG_02036 [Coccidioides posadasii str. Silveira]
MSIEPTSKQLLVMESWHLASFYGVTVSIMLFERRDRLGLFQECLLSGPKTTPPSIIVSQHLSVDLLAKMLAAFVSNALSHQRLESNMMLKAPWDSPYTLHGAAHPMSAEDSISTHNLIGTWCFCISSPSHVPIIHKDPSPPSARGGLCNDLLNTYT